MDSLIKNSEFRGLFGYLKQLLVNLLVPLFKASAVAAYSFVGET
jgi:hypothetical protein